MIFQEHIIPSMPVGIWSLKQVLEFYDNAPNHNFKKLTYGTAPESVPKKSWSVKVWKPFASWLHFDKHLSNSSRYIKNAWKHQALLQNTTDSYCILLWPTKEVCGPWTDGLTIEYYSWWTSLSMQLLSINPFQLRKKKMLIPIGKKENQLRKKRIYVGIPKYQSFVWKALFVK